MKIAIRMMALLVVMAALSITACNAATPTPALGSTTLVGQPTITTLSGYRPLQSGDEIEGATIGYQFILPSQDRAAVVLAFSPYLLHFVSLNPDLSGGVVPFMASLPKDKSIYAFDEADSKQIEPKPLIFDAGRPIEIAFISLTEGKHNWSVTEVEDNEVQAAYKIVRRKDGGLRFIDAYGKNAIYSAGALSTQNGTGVGLILSARLALLRMILSDPKYQRGVNVMETNPPALTQYDPRILKIDTSKSGLSMNQDWVLISQPGPNGGLAAP
jgi:hypothetical protein